MIHYIYIYTLLTSVIFSSFFFIFFIAPDFTRSNYFNRQSGGGVPRVLYNVIVLFHDDGVVSVGQTRGLCKHFYFRATLCAYHCRLQGVTHSSGYFAWFVIFFFLSWLVEILGDISRLWKTPRWIVITYIIIVGRYSNVTPIPFASDCTHHLIKSCLKYKTCYNATPIHIFDYKNMFFNPKQISICSLMIYIYFFTKPKRY